MRLIVKLLESHLTQVLIPKKTVNVGAVRPHIYLHNNPEGSLKVQILTEDDVLISESDEIEISQITSAPEYHGYVTFNVSASLLKGTRYKFSVVAANGYEFSELSYCAVCNDYDLRKYDTTTPVVHSTVAPLDLEIWSRSNK